MSPAHFTSLLPEQRPSFPGRCRAPSCMAGCSHLITVCHFPVSLVPCATSRDTSGAGVKNLLLWPLTQRSAGWPVAVRAARASFGSPKCSTPPFFRPHGTPSCMSVSVEDHAAPRGVVVVSVLFYRFFSACKTSAEVDCFC